MDQWTADLTLNGLVTWPHSYMPCSSILVEGLPVPTELLTWASRPHVECACMCIHMCDYVCMRMCMYIRYACACIYVCLCVGLIIHWY